MNWQEAWETYVEHATNPLIEGTLSIEELSIISGIPSEDLLKSFNTEPWKSERLAQGYPPPLLRKNDSDLTEKQLRWIRVITSPFTSKSLTLLAAEHGVSIEEHRYWMGLPHFARAYNSRMRQESNTAKPEIFRRTMNKAVQGDLKATETYFRMINEPLPSLMVSTGGAGTVPLDTLMKVLQKVLPQELLMAVALELMGPQEEPLELMPGEYEEVQPETSLDHLEPKGPPPHSV